jgi:hypothetical protein
MARPASRPAFLILRSVGSIGSSTSTWKVIAAGVDEVVDVPARLGDHQVRVERLLAYLAEPFDDGRPEGDVRDEVAVHDVEVDSVRAGPECPSRLLA